MEKYITQYPIDGDNVVTKPSFSYSPPSEGCPTGGVGNTPSEKSSTVGVVNSTNNKNEKTLYINSIQLRLNPVLGLPYNPVLKKRARDLRQAENLSEVLFWMQVTKGGFHKIDFDRQRVIGNYIVDFYVKKLGLVIEIDGSSHIGKEEYDKAREDYLCSLGLRVYRIQVIDVMKRMVIVMRDLEIFLIENYGELDFVVTERNEPLYPSGTNISP